MGTQSTWAKIEEAKDKAKPESNIKEKIEHSSKEADKQLSNADDDLNLESFLSENEEDDEEKKKEESRKEKIKKEKVQHEKALKEEAAKKKIEKEKAKKDKAEKEK